jgi:tripartite-type tricarboxylate transporter receptor subunit TctC
VKTSFCGLVAACFVAFAVPTVVSAQGAFPSKPLRIVVSASVGGATDQVARSIGHFMSTAFGQPVSVENRTGANGVVGAGVVASSLADGHTLCFCSTFTSPSTVKQLYTVNNLIPVTRAYDLNPMIIVPANSPYKTLADLIAGAKQKGGAFGHTGTNGVLHLAFEELKQRAGFDMTPVAYQGETPIMPDLISGRLDAAVVSTLLAKQQAEAGRVRVLAGFGNTSTIAGVPTVAASGYPNLVFTTWGGVFLPLGTPAPIVAQIWTAVQAALRDPAVSQRIASNGLLPIVDETPEQFLDYIRTSNEKLRKTMRGLGLEPV